MAQWRCTLCGRYCKRGYLMCRPCRRVLDYIKREFNATFIN